MNEQTTQLIEKLAEQLGTTSEYLWGVLISQAPISALKSLILIGLTIVFTFMVWKIHKGFMRNTDDEHINYTYYDEYEPVAHILVGGLGVFALIMFGLSIEAGGNAITALLNPEYWALQQILESVK